MAKAAKTPEFTGFSPRTLKFIHALSLNNEKPWFLAHKTEFLEHFQKPMKALGQAVFLRVAGETNSRGFIHKVSRIYRDARYMRAGDGPYRTSMWFSIEHPTAGEWTDRPVFWFDLSPDGWSYGMGYGGAKAETMTKFRANLDKKPQEFEKIIANLDQQSEFVLDGPEYARPKSAPTPKLASWYNKKSFSLIHRQVNDEELFSPELADRIARGMLLLLQLYDYLAADE